MKIEQQRDDEVTVLRPVGQLTVATKDSIGRAADEALARGDRFFVLDFAKTAYIDAPGVAELAAIARSVLDRGGAMRAAALDDDLRSLFELSKLDTIVPIDADADAAIASFRI